VYLGAKRRYINTLPFLSFPLSVLVSRSGAPCLTDGLAVVKLDVQVTRLIPVYR